MVCSKKLDKIDKLVISLTFIIVTFACIFNTFSNASENIEPITINDLGIDPKTKTIISTPNTVLKVFEVVPGRTYKFTTNTAVNTTFTSELPELGLSLGNVEKYEIGSYEFTVNNEKYLYFSGHIHPNSNIQLEDITKPGLGNAIANLVGVFGFGFFDNILINIIPFILVVVLFSFGVWLIKYYIIEHSKGRDS